MAYSIDIGMLGLGARSTSFYLTYLNQIYNEKLGGDSTCPLTLVNANFDQINPYLPDQFEKLVAALKTYVSSMNYHGLIIPNITLHETLDKMEISNLVHPVHETIRVLIQAGHSRIKLLGSLYSMRAPYLSGLMRAAGIDVVTPSEPNQNQFDIWRKKTYAYQETVSDIRAYEILIQRYSQREPVVIACTELSVILGQDTNNIYDMARIQMQAAIH